MNHVFLCWLELAFKSLSLLYVSGSRASHLLPRRLNVTEVQSSTLARENSSTNPSITTPQLPYNKKAYLKEKLITAPMTQESMPREVKPMEASTSMPSKKEANRGAWTAEEDRKLAQVIAVHGAKRWKIIAAKAGLNRCGKSCRLRWLNYLRPNIKRGNISDQEEDLILRLHKLLGNRWSLIAGRLPGRTDNEIKNYWNSHLSKKISQKEKQGGTSTREGSKAEKREVQHVQVEVEQEKINASKSDTNGADEQSNICFNVDDFFDFSNEDPLNLEWMSQFLEVGDSLTGTS